MYYLAIHTIGEMNDARVVSYLLRNSGTIKTECLNMSERHISRRSSGTPIPYGEPRGNNMTIGNQCSDIMHKRPEARYILYMQAPIQVPQLQLHYDPALPQPSHNPVSAPNYRGVHLSLKTATHLIPAIHISERISMYRNPLNLDWFLWPILLVHFHNFKFIQRRIDSINDLAPTISHSLRP